MNQPQVGEALVLRIAGDVSVAVPNQLQLLTTYVLLEQETWFEDEAAFLGRCLRPGLRMLDVGANYGMYALPLARLAGPEGRVWAVEPSCNTSDFLRASAGRNQLGWMQVIRCALSNRTGTARLRLEANAELNTLVEDGAPGAFEEVPLMTLDALAAEHGCTRIDFLKLDAEGEEERIVEGGAAFLRNERPLLMYEIRHGERINLALAARLAAAGYASYRLIPGLDLLAPFDPAAEVDPFQLNLFACKPERASLLERDGWLAQGSCAIADDAGNAFLLHRNAHDRARPAAARLASLAAAHQALSRECAQSKDPYLLGSAARVAWELGERRGAMLLLSRAMSICTQRDPGPPPAQFIAASPAFDTVAPAGRHAAWLEASLLDQYVSLSAYSSYFAPKDTLPLLERIKATGFQRAPMERRRQLMRILAGLQPAPEPAACLSAMSPDNLNPGLWCPTQ